MNKENLLKNLFKKHFKNEAINYDQLPPSGSNREYYRLKNDAVSAIGVYNNDRKENDAFISFTKQFIANKLTVPQLYEEQLDADVYLLEDLGDETLFSKIVKLRSEDDPDDQIIDLYKNVLTELPKFQVDAAKDFDYTHCYPRKKFDRQSMLWDLSYFKYYFLKLAKISFNEQLIEDDFHNFTNFLLSADSKYFLYRDYQSRNIMLKDDKSYFIDYQGGRKGPLQYDVASLLFDAKAELTFEMRTELLEFYISLIKDKYGIDKYSFIEYYKPFILIRILQAMGAYGFRGFYERKSHFLKSIPPALNNMEWLLNNWDTSLKLPHLFKCLEQMINSDELRKHDYPLLHESDLTVSIKSFSYKKQIPKDHSGNGGGFVFDCRAIHNPGRYEQYKHQTGRDEDVIDFLKKESDIDKFLENVFQLVDLSVENYITRGFKNLMVSFGCTGGQHRSVYCAEELAKHLHDKYKVKVQLMHTELGKE
ncbi:MAG: phosphotransferase [Ignavibacteriaceae bacterium]|nr:phosphotransferase [Ignavibacteriaceae bacterium]